MCNDYYKENEESENDDKRLENIEDALHHLVVLVEEIREKVDEKTFRKKIETANRLIRTAEDLNAKAEENMKRINDMLLKLKGCVAVALGNMSA